MQVTMTSHTHDGSILLTADVDEAVHCEVLQEVQSKTVHELQIGGVQEVQSGAIQDVQSGTLQEVPSGAVQEVQSDATKEVQSGAGKEVKSGAVQEVQSGEVLSDGDQKESLIVDSKCEHGAWKYSQKKSIKLTKTPFKVKLSNRFSCLEIYEVDETKCDTLKPKTKGKSKRQIFKNSIIEEQRLNKQLLRKSFETKNLSEVEIGDIINGHRNNDNGTKIKCNNCNFKTWCHLERTQCKATESTCNKCKKKNHFPKSRSCLKLRKEKSKEKSSRVKLKSGCETLRNF